MCSVPAQPSDTYALQVQVEPAAMRPVRFIQVNGNAMGRDSSRHLSVIRSVEVQFKLGGVKDPILHKGFDVRLASLL